MGGRKAVMEFTGLSKGRLSQWVGENRIPEAWMAAFRALRPDQLGGVPTPIGLGIEPVPPELTEPTPTEGAPTPAGEVANG